jgi:P4 family phage/plasmid primase-like protien
MKMIKYSINENIINKGDPKLTGWHNQISGVDDFIEKVTKKGFAFSSILKDNYQGIKPKIEDVLSFQVIALDIDNSDPKLKKGTNSNEYFSFEDAQKDEFIQNNAYLIYTTPSHTIEHNRFRIVFICDNEIFDFEYYKILIVKLIDMFGADVMCKSLERMFYGNSESDVRIFGNILSAKIADDIVNEYKSAKQINQNYKSNDISIDLVREMLSFIPKQLEYNEWFSILSGIGNIFDENTAVSLIEDWSPSNNPNTLYKIRHRAKNINLGSVIYYAKKYGWNGQVPNKQKNKDYLSQVSIAEDVALKYNHSIKFNHTNGKWYIFNNHFWKIDTKKQIVNLIKDNLKGGSISKYKKFLTKSNIDSIISLCSSIPEISKINDDFDKNKYLLNLKNGTYNLQTNQLQSHNPHELLSKIIDIEYNPDAQCINFQGFISTIFDDNEMLIKFVQRAVGLSLCGENLEAKLFFCYGNGRNGKSVFFNVLERILGDYFIKAPTEMILNRNNNSIPNDIAMLPGSRLCVVGEIPENKSLSEARVKDLTSGDPITGRFMRQEYFSFFPTHTLWIYGNHKPNIYGNDFGIWRRICLIPFSVTIKESSIIPAPILMAMFEKEKSGILNWIIEGWREYQRIGLKEPEIIKEQSQIYKNEQDIIIQFVNENCKLEKNQIIKASELYSSYSNWCKNCNERPYKNQKFYKRIEEIDGVKCMEVRNYKIFHGIGIINHNLGY